MPRLYKQIDAIENVGGTITLTRFDGGLNLTKSNEILSDNEAIIRKGWGQEDRGAIRKVKGFTKANSTKLASAYVQGLFRVYRSDITSTKKLLAICNGVVSYSDDDGVNFTGATGGTGFSATDFFRGVNYNDLFFFTSKTDNLYKYTPSTNTVAACTDQPTVACEVLLRRADRRLLALVNSTNGSALYYSKVDPTGAAADDWSATNDAGSISIDGAKSQPLTGGATLGAVDIIFKSHAAFKVWGYPAPQVIKIEGAPGCAAPHSISQGGGLMFHLAHDGIWLYDGNRFIKISEPIKSIIDSISKTNKRKCFGAYRAGLYWFFYPTGTNNQDCIIYDVERSNPYQNQNVWFERDGLSMNCPLVFNGAGDENELYAGSSSATGFVYRLDYSTDGSDDSENINAVYQTKYFNDGYAHLVKRFSNIRIRYYNSKGNLLINWYTNRGTKSGSYNISLSEAGTKLGTFVLGTNLLVGSTEATDHQRMPDDCVGTDISLKITHNDITTGDNPPIIRDISIDWEALYEN